jgi:hypothetical protein
MLGPAKPRRLDAPIAVSLEDLVPRNHFYRHLETKLDLSFVREWARELYAERGRPSMMRSRTRVDSGRAGSLSVLGQEAEYRLSEERRISQIVRGTGDHHPLGLGQATSEFVSDVAEHGRAQLPAQQ